MENSAASSSITPLGPAFTTAQPLSNQHDNDEATIDRLAGQLDQYLRPSSPSIKGKEKADPILVDDEGQELFYRPYRSEEEDMEDIMRLCAMELSEPYNVQTFRYFLETWPHLTLLVYPSPRSKQAIAIIMCKQDSHNGKINRGYIAMLSVDRSYRRRGIASNLVTQVIEEMQERGADEIVIETEFDNEGSLALYEALGFVKERRLEKFYTNLKDAFRLILPLPSGNPYIETEEEADEGRWFIGSGPEDLMDQIPMPDAEQQQPLLNGSEHPGGPYSDQANGDQQDDGKRPGTPLPKPPPLPPRPWEDLYT